MFFPCCWILILAAAFYPSVNVTKKAMQMKKAARRKPGGFSML
jgi:hypothetical protein